MTTTGATATTAAAMAATAVEAATTELVRSPQDDAGRPGDEAARAALDTLYRRHHVLVGRICSGLLRDREDAADAAQQTFLHAYRALRRGVVPEEPHAWLATIARNECLGQIRARMRAPLAEELGEVASGKDVAEHVASRASVVSLVDELRRLPPHQRDAFVLREFAGLHYEELAAALGVSTSAVESLLVRARTHLRARLRAVAATVNLSGAVARVAELATKLLDPAVPRLGAMPRALAATAGVVALGGAGFAELDHASGRPLHRSVRHAVVSVQRPRLASRRAATVPRRVPRDVPAASAAAPVSAPRAILTSAPVPARTRTTTRRAVEPAEAEHRRTRAVHGGRSPRTSGGDEQATPTARGDGAGDGGDAVPAVTPPPTMPAAAATGSSDDGGPAQRDGGTMATSTSSTTTITVTDDGGDRGRDGADGGSGRDGGGSGSGSGSGDGGSGPDG